MKIKFNADSVIQKEGKDVYVFNLTNKNGLKAKVTNYGAKVMSLIVPDKNGVFRDIVLGYDTIEEYFKGNSYFGALVGRYANRIKDGKFKIGNSEYQVSQNEGKNHLHGGFEGFQDKVWDVVDFKIGNNESFFVLTYLSEDGEEGYPGNLAITIKIILTEKNELKFEYYAETDKPTIVNLTQHSFFNLDGEGDGKILDHKLLINGSKIAEIDSETIPTGTLIDIENTIFDFGDYKKIGADINDEKLWPTSGFDNSFLIHDESKEMPLAAKVYSEKSGILMNVFTTQPTIHLYTGNFLSKDEIGKSRHVYDQYAAFCLEVQHFANSPNIDSFPTTVLKPGETYWHTTSYQFEIHEKQPG